MVELGVNINHVATVREARRTNEPDPVWAATLAQLGGADGITLHLREDRRHIQDRDLRILRETVTVKLNLELACNQDVLEIACQTRPDQATLVPERREEVTTEGGLMLAQQRTKNCRNDAPASGRRDQSQPVFRSRSGGHRHRGGVGGRRRRIAYRAICLGRRCGQPGGRTCPAGRGRQASRRRPLGTARRSRI